MSPSVSQEDLKPTMSDLERVLQKDKNRYRILRKIYDVTDGNENGIVQFLELARQEGLTEDQANDAYDWLLGENLVETHGPRRNARITHLGKLEVEQSIKNPNVSTEHFRPQVIQYFMQISGGVHSSNVAGGGSTIANSSANITEGASGSELVQILQQVRQRIQALPPDERREADELVDALEAEATSDNSSKIKLKAFASLLLPTLERVAT